MRSGHCVPSPTTTQCRKTPALATARFTMHCGVSKPICISTYTWKTTSSSRARLRSKQSHRAGHAVLIVASLEGTAHALSVASQASTRSRHGRIRPLLRRLRCHVGDDAAWGFGAKWLPTLLGTPPPNKRVLALAVMLHGIAIALALAGLFRITTALIVISSLLAIISLRLFARPERPAKTKGIHGSFPVFVRVAYVWLIIAALLGVWAANAPNSSGIWGASRHALTVGFIAVMVFCVGQRILPAFSGMRLLFSPRLMFAGLALLTAGCLLRVSCAILA